MMEKLNWFDILVLILLVRSTYIGFRRGLAIEFFKFFGLIISGFLAFYFYERLGASLFLHTFLAIEIANILSFILILLGGVTLFGVMGRIMRKVVQFSLSAHIDTIGGLACGLFRGAVVASLTVVLLAQVPSAYVKESVGAKSFSGPHLFRVGSWVYNLVMKFYPEQINAPRSFKKN